MKKITTALFLSLVLSGTAWADPATECGGSSQVEIGNCVADTLARVDATIDIYLGFAKRSAEELDAITGRDVSAPALDAAQAAWSAFRDAQCDYVGTSFGGGSGTGIAINACKVELGRTRADELMRHIQ